jgi:diguanylate cyclase (GGDEF)-like protein/PAS domain S-box-containing protein
MATGGVRELLVALAVWSLLVGLSLWFNVRNQHNEAVERARLVAEAYIEKDLAVRRWITGHGGVYVPPSAQTPPNPWLNHPERDVTTDTGKVLTLVNPAYATRQLLEDFAAQSGIRGHLTALKLTNPNNAPDAWEKAALERLERGEKSIVELQARENVPVLRVMRPVLMEKGCNRCHAELAIPLGAVRGGLSTSVPMEPFWAADRSAVNRLMASHGAIWLVGLAGIGISVRRRLVVAAQQLKALHTAQRDDRRVAELLVLSERLDQLSEKEIIQQGLEVAVRLTDSAIGFLHFMHEDENAIELVAWSKATLESYCTAAYDNHYPIEKAGIWADCARLHQPVVHNDYPNLGVKRGLPEGHADLQRLLSVPVIEAGKVCVIAGVGNKQTDYEDHDVRLLQLLANDIWKLVQRKRAVVELRISEQRFRDFSASSADWFWELDEGLRYTYFSENFAKTLGLDPASLLGRTRRELLEGDGLNSAEAIAAHLTQIERHEAFRNFEYRMRDAGGKIRWVAVSGVPCSDDDGHFSGYRGTGQNVTELREVELLRRSEANLNALFEHTDRLIWSVDSQCRLVVGNSLFLSFMRQILGREIAKGDVLPPAELPAPLLEQWQAYYRRAFHGEQFAVEVQWPAEGEVVRWMDFSFFPITDAKQGTVTGINVFGRDFTERREMEETQIRTLGQMAKLVRELESHHRDTQRINQLNDLLQSCRDESEAQRIIALEMTELFPGRPGSFAKVMANGIDLERVSSWGEALVQHPQFTVDDCWALRRGQLHDVRRGSELACTHLAEVPAGGYLCLPLMVHGEMIGLLSTGYLPQATDAERDAQRELAVSVGETIKLSLSNLRLRVALQEQATHDALTGLYNRRYLDDTLPRELHRCQRVEGRLSVAMIDIDHFKRFNDSMGHDAGDQVLREIGRLLRDNLRRSDVGCRYGGEELAVIMPDSTAADALARMTQVCTLIRSMRVGHHGTILPQVTVSVGIAELTTQRSDAHALLRGADEALYRAKEGGRDRIVVCE